jgi:hypothetical protein
VHRAGSEATCTASTRFSCVVASMLREVRTTVFGMEYSMRCALKYEQALSLRDSEPLTQCHGTDCLCAGLPSAQGWRPCSLGST